MNEDPLKMTVTQQMVDAIIKRAEDDSPFGLESPAGKSTSIRNYDPPNLTALSMLLVGGWHAKYDLISVMAAAFQEIAKRAAGPPKEGLTLKPSPRDINGEIISFGSKVCAYERTFECAARTEIGGVEVFTLDTARPRPLKDVPLLKGTVVWDAEQLCVMVRVDELLAKWEAPPSAIRMDLSSYAFELLKEEPNTTPHENASKL